LTIFGHDLPHTDVGEGHAIPNKKKGWLDKGLVVVAARVWRREARAFFLDERGEF
jgi:hypothetical protein